MALRLRSNAPAIVRDDDDALGRLRRMRGETEEETSSAVSKTEEKEETEERSPLDRLQAMRTPQPTKDREAPAASTPAARAPASETTPAAVPAQESNPTPRIFSNAVDRLKQAQRGAEYGTDPEAIRADLEEMDARQTATAAKLESLAEPLQRANVAAQTYGSQVKAYETKLGMLSDTITNSEDPEERRRAQQEARALDLGYQKAQRAAERYGAQANELNAQAQQLVTQLQEVGAGMEPRIERYNELLSWGDRRAATLERQAEEIRNRQRSLGAGLYQMTPEQQDEYWAMGKQANDLERAAARERGNYAQHLYNTQGAEKANAYLSGAEAGNRAKAETNGFIGKVLNTAGGAALNFTSGVGSTLITMARIMELPEDALYWITGDERFNLDREPYLRNSEALQASDTFREEAERMKGNAGNLGSKIIDISYAAGNMMGASAFAGQALGAIGNSGAIANLESIANSSPLLTSRAARYGARLGAGVLKEIVSNPGNFGVAASSAVNNYSTALANGATFEQAMSNGLQKGVLEYLSNKMFSGTPFVDAPGQQGYVTKLIEYVAGKLGKSGALAKLNASTGGKVLNWFLDKSGEGLEEVITAIGDPLIDRITYDRNADLATADELVDEYIGGVLLSLLMTGGEKILSGPEALRGNRQISDFLVDNWGMTKAEADKYAPKLRKAIRATEEANQAAAAIQRAEEADRRARGETTPAAEGAGITEAQAAAAPVEAANENTPPVPGAVQQNGPPVPQGVQNAPQAEQTAENAPPVPGAVQENGPPVPGAVMENAAETAGTVQETETMPQTAVETRTETAANPTGRARLEAAMATEEQTAGEATPRTERLRLPTARETLAPAPERVNLLANNRTEGTNNGTAAAENTGADVSDRNGRRGSGERTRREAAKLARETKEWRALPQQDKAAGRQAHADDLHLEQVEARSLGVTSAAEGSTVRVYPRSEWEPDLQRIAARVEKATGQNVTFVLGQIRVDNNGKPLSVRGVNTGRGIIVQADALGVSAEKIATHEAYHSFSRMDPTLSGRVLEQIRKTYPENRLREIAETYLAKMNGIVDLESTDQAVLARALGQVREEICADAYAGINAFSARADEYTEPARKAVSESRNRQTEEATERRTGPPEGYSASDSDTEYLYSAAEDEEFPADEVQKRIRELETELETITPSAEERNRLSVSKSKTDRAKLRNVDKQRREIMKEIDRLSKLEPQVRQLANKLEKLRDIEYQKDLLEAGGYQAVKENEQTIRQLERQLKRLKTLNTEQEAKEKMTAEEAEPEDEGPESIPESAAEYDRLKKQGKIKESPKRNPPIRPQQESDRNEEREETGEEPIPESAAEYGQLKRQGKVKAPKVRRPVSKSRATIAKADLKKNLLGMYSIPAGSKAELGAMIDALADRYIREGRIDENDRRELLDKLYASGVVTLAADDGVQAVRDLVRNGRIYVSEKVKTEWKDTDYNDFRRQAMAEGIYLVNDETARSWDSWNAELAEAFPGIFDADEYNPRAALERIVQVAREGRGEKLSLAEYAAQMAGVEYATEDDMMDNLERQADYALRTFGEKANLEIYLKDRTGRMIAQERQRMGELRDQAVQKERERGDERVKAAKERGQELLSKERANEIKLRQQEREHRKEVAKRLRERQNMQELQQKTLKQLQWLSTNRNKFPGDMKAEVDKILEDIDIYAASVAEEMHIDPKTGKTWRELRDIYQEAKKNDPNFMPSAELERIVARLDYKKVGDLDIGALNDLFKAAVGLRTELYNRNNVIEDELHSTFAEVYDAVKEEMREAPGSYQTGVKGGIDAFLSDAQLTPMNRFQRMAGWNPNSRWYGMAKMLEKGEREQRRFETEAAKQLAPVLVQYADWARRADGQGKDAIWYEVKVPESWEYHMGDKPVFSDKTVTVYMTPAQKVHMYLESKNLDNLRHMEGGRTFADKELYSKGKRAEAFAQGKTVKLLPETVKNIVSDLTEEEQALANALEAFYNNYSKQEINRVSNILYGYDKAMGGYYAPIYTNNNYTKSEPGIFDLTAEGVGNLKSRTVSANPSLNLSAFDAFEKSVDKTGRFVGLSIPIRNLNTLINWRESGNSTKEILDHKWGEKTTQWVEDLMTELQSGKERSSSSIEELTNKVLSRYITAVFGANPSIVIKQFASHPLAATYLKWGNLINGLLHVGQADPELISKYTGELDYRMLGYATPETAQLKDNPGILQRKGPINFLLGGGAITWMDGFTVRTLWSAAEQKVSREQPDLDVGTQEQINAGQSPYYQAVAREFEEAVSRSQPMYDTMHRSNIMRETNPLTRAFTLFKTVPQQEYNMLRQAVGEAAYYKRIGADAETQAEARQRAGRAFAGILIGNLMIDVVTFLNALWKNKGKKFRDEDGKITPQSVAAGLAKQYIRDAAGLAIGGDVAADVLSSILFGDKWYGLEMPGLEQLGSILEQSVNAGKTVQKLVADSIDILQNGGEWGQYMADHKEEYINAVDQIVSILATYGTGLPIENVKAYLLGGVQWISPQIKTTYDDIMKKADKSGLKGLKGASLETRTMHIFQDRAGDADASTAKTIAGLYAAGYTDAVPAAIAGSYTINGETRNLNAADEQQYSAAWQDAVSGTLDRITRDVNFRAADQQTQAKTLKTLYDLASQEAKAAVWPDYEPDAYIQTAKDLERNAGIPLEEWLPIRTVIGTFTTERDASGKEIRGKSKKDKVAQYINGLKQYSRNQKDALWAAAGYKNPEDTAWHGGSSGRGKTYSMGGLRLPTPERREPTSSGLRLQSAPAARPSGGGLRLK